MGSRNPLTGLSGLQPSLFPELVGPRRPELSRNPLTGLSGLQLHQAELGVPLVGVAIPLRG